MRWAAALVIVANLVFFAFTRGWLDGPDGARGDREPERLQRQLHPETVQLLSPAAAAVALAAASAASASTNGVCLEAGPFADPELAAAQDALQFVGLAPGQWTTPSQEKPGAWLVYMGKFPDRDTALRKAVELDRIHVAHEEVKQPELAPGLSLGRFDSQAGAEAALGQFTQRGVRTAKVVQVQPPSTTHLIRFESADESLAGRLVAMKAVALGAGFRRCGSGG